MSSANAACAGIAAVAFDYGGVLCPALSGDAVGDFAALAGVSAARFADLYAVSRGAYDRGAVSAEDCWWSFGRLTGQRYDAERIRALIAMDLSLFQRVDDRMLGWVARLRKAGLRTAILSNMPHELRQELRSRDWLHGFDVQVLSCDHGLIKPEPAIYQRLLDRPGASRPAGALHRLPAGQHRGRAQPASPVLYIGRLTRWPIAALIAARRQW